MHIENRYDRKRYERDKLEALANEPDSGVYFDESKGRYVRDKFKKKKVSKNKWLTSKIR